MLESPGKDLRQTSFYKESFPNLTSLNDLNATQVQSSDCCLKDTLPSSLFFILSA